MAYNTPSGNPHGNPGPVGPPPGPGMAPPPPGPDMGPPPGGATPEGAMEMDAAVAEKKLAAMMDTRPVPEKPYTISVVKKLADQISGTIEKIAGTEIPLPEWEAPPGKGKLIDPETKEPLALPAEVYIPAAVLSEAIKTVDAEGDFEKYSYDPGDFVNDGELKVAISKLKMAAGDKALKTALMEPQALAVGPEEEGEDRLKGPEEMTEDEQMLSENL
jgi:hypothetical protein